MEGIPEIFPSFVDAVPCVQRGEEQHGVPVASITGSAFHTPTSRPRRRRRRRRKRRQETTADRVVLRPEPPELDVVREFTEGIESPLERLFMVGKMGELPPSPYYRARIYQLLETDVKSLVGTQMNDILSETTTDEDDAMHYRSVMTDAMQCLGSALWLSRYTHDFCIKIKKATTAEGQLGKETQADDVNRSINPVRRTMAIWFETLDNHWRVQRDSYDASLMETIMSETIILWLLNSMMSLCRTGIRRILTSTCAAHDLRRLYAFQERYPSIGIFVGPDDVSVVKYDQNTLLLAVETLVEHWSEIPWSHDLLRYVNLLYDRYVLLACTTFRLDGEATMNRPGMFHNSAPATNIPVNPAPSKGALFYDMRLSFQDISTDDSEEDGDAEEGPDIFHISEEYVTFGEEYLAPIVLQTEWMSRTFADCESVRRATDITVHQFMSAMRHFVGYLKTTAQGRGTREFVKYAYRDAVFNHLLRPGEAVRFRRKHPLDTFSPENIISVTRREDIDRITKHILSVDISEIITFYDEEFTEEEEEEEEEHESSPSGEPNRVPRGKSGGSSLTAILQSIGSSSEPMAVVEDEEPRGPGEIVWDDLPLQTETSESTFTDSWNAWTALQHVCLGNFFVCSDFYKTWDDIFIGHGHDEIYEPRFVMQYFHGLTPTLAAPIIFRVAGSFMVYLPWDRTIIWDDDFRYYEGSIGSALYVAMTELRWKLKRIETMVQYVDASPAMIEEAELLGEMVDVCLEKLYGEKHTSFSPP